jgi:cell division protein ZipA
MDGLRWLLLLFGLLVIAGVYLYSRRDKSAPDTDPVPDRLEPTLGGEEQNKTAEPVPEEPSAADPEPAESLQKIVTMRMVAKDGGSFAGDELILSMRGIGLRHGKFGIFHRYEGTDENNAIFSAASLVEPGSFDLSNIKEQRLPGISLFLILPGPIEGAEAFDLMMAAARALAKALDAELLDESGSTLSIQRERYLREEIIQFEHSIKVA